MSDEELVRRYLLGDLPGDEMEALEQRLLRDDDLFELAEALEADVLEDYARGELAPAQQARVTRYLSGSPEGRLRLAVVRGLAALPATRTAPEEGRLLSFPKLAADLNRPRVRAAAIAAMLALAAGGGWLATRIQTPPARLANRLPATPLESPSARPEPNPSPPPDRSAASTPPPAPVAAPAPSPVVFVATLALSSLRGEDQVPSFDIPSRADTVELRLILPKGDEGYPSYRVVLSDAAGREVTKGEGLHASRSGRMALRVDAGRLPAGRYSLTVQGVTPEGAEDLGFPEFEVREP
jgi:hypothetical protein